MIRDGTGCPIWMQEAARSFGANHSKRCKRRLRISISSPPRACVSPVYDQSLQFGPYRFQKDVAIDSPLFLWRLSPFGLLYVMSMKLGNSVDALDGGL